MTGGHILNSWSNRSRAGSSGAGPPWPAAPPACGGQSSGPLLWTNGVASEDRTFDARTLHDRACARIKGPESSGHGVDAFEGPGEAPFTPRATVVRTVRTQLEKPSQTERGIARPINDRERVAIYATYITTQGDKRCARACASNIGYGAGEVLCCCPGSGRVCMYVGASPYGIPLLPTYTRPGGGGPCTQGSLQL